MTVTGEQAWKIAEDWVAAWNAHDLEAILSHYDDGVELISPMVGGLLAIKNCKFTGKEKLRAYVRRGLECYPELRFQLEDVLCGINSVVLYYTNQAGTRNAEFMEFSRDHKVIRVVANYSAKRVP